MRTLAEGIIITDSARDQTELPLEAILAEERIPMAPTIVPMSEFDEWSSFWLRVWVGTALSGGAFGVIVVVGGLVSQLLFAPGGPPEIIFGAALGVVLAAVVGTLWAGFVGVLIVPTVAILAWSFFCLRYPRTIAAVAGGLTGAASVGFTPIYSVFTATVGAIGGAIAAKNYWKESQTFRHAVEAYHEPGYRFHFTIKDLLLRTTAAALLISVWMFVFRMFHHF